MHRAFVASPSLLIAVALCTALTAAPRAQSTLLPRTVGHDRAGLLDQHAAGGLDREAGPPCCSRVLPHLRSIPR
jgi:hypothetical protein